MLQAFPTAARVLMPRWRRGCCRSGPGPGNNADSLSCRRAVAFKGERISEAMAKPVLSLELMQLAQVCSFNAFEVAYPDVHQKEASACSISVICKAQC